MDSAIEDVAYLSRSPYRFAVLDALAAGPRTRADLKDETGVSGPTVARILGDFEERRWIVREGADYRATPLGEYVAGHVGDAIDALEAERRLRDVVDWLPIEMDDFDVELFADAVVSYPGPAYPYEPVERVSELIDGSASMRGFSTTVLKAANLEVLCRNILDGMNTEVIYDPVTFRTVREWDGERAAAAAACDNCTVLLHDDLPDQVRCGFALFPERVALCCHDHETGQLRAIVDTDDPDAMAWAESVYEPYREAARPLEETESVGDPAVESA